jgi:hypothetical protein
VAAALPLAANAASAATLKLCMPKAEGSALLTPKHGKCKKGYKLTGLSTEGEQGTAGKEGKAGAEGKVGPEGKKGETGTKGETGPAGVTGLSSAEMETLKSILPDIKYVSKGVGGVPTIQFSSVNVQIESGATSEEPEHEINGKGNLLIGFDEEPGTQTGSNNLVVGAEQAFTSYGGFVAGVENVVTGPFASVSGGEHNTASAEGATVSGGEQNQATESDASVSGGASNIAEGRWSSILGGHSLKTKGEYETSPP